MARASRCFTRNGHDWADRFPAIVDAAQRLKAPSFLIDGEAVIARDDERKSAILPTHSTSRIRKRSFLEVRVIKAELSGWPR
jgi:ATP-dependent DNA ligase